MTGKMPRAVIVSMLAVVGGVFLFRRIKRARPAERDDARLDDMVEQSFPASDAPAY